MTLISSRASLVERCATQRNANIGTDDGYNNPLPPAWVDELDDVPCRAWVSGHETVSTAGDVSVVVETKLVVPVGTDIVEGDRIVSVTRDGAEVQPGPLSVHAVLRRRDHLEVITSKAT